MPLIVPLTRKAARKNLHKPMSQVKRTALAAMAAMTIQSSAAGIGSDSTFVKQGFSFGVLPAVSYDSDLGFQYGVLSNLYWYGDGSRYPAYDHSLYLECSRYPAGTMLCRAYYDSPCALSGLDENLRLTADFTWYRDLLNDFYGFNGRKAVYHETWTDDEAGSNYRSRGFYAHHRRMTRLMAGVRYNIPGEKAYAQIGVTAFNFDCGPIKRSELRHSLPDVPSLYDLYRQWGVIRDDEAGGGTDVFIRLGLGLDTRDAEGFPTQGIWSEALLAIEPNSFNSNGKGFIRLTVNHRQYFSLGSRDLVLAYRLTLQNRLCGHVAYSLLPHITTNTLTSATSQGLGGSKTMRGVKRNRIVADGIALANVELRWIINRFELLGQQWAIGTNVFTDWGMATQNYKIDTGGVPGDEAGDFFRSGNDKPHGSAGVGLKIHMNSNFIVSADYGHALKGDDGAGGLYINLNYLF